MNEVYKNDKLLNTPSRWVLEIDKAKQRREKFIKEADHIEKTFRGDVTVEEAWDGHGTPYKTNTFNILYSNTKILEPAVFSRMPKPICRPQFISNKIDDYSVESAAAEVMQRALEQSLEQYDFKAEVKSAVKDSLLPGEGQISVNYDAEIVDNKVKYEYAICEYENYEDVLYGYAKRWKDVPWVGFRRYMSRADLEKKFGAKGKKCPLNKQAEVKDRVINQEHMLDRAEVWKILDKETGDELFICDAMPEEFLSKEPQPVKFKNKLPVPKPLNYIETTGCLLPVPLFRMYSTQAKQLEKVSRRILILTDALRVRGVYDSSLSELEKLFKSGDNEMIPVTNGARFQETGFDRSIWMLPLNEIVTALIELKKQERSIIEIIYEITGISDIMRGSTSAIETARAQELKSNFGTLPLQDMQEKVQGFIAEILKLKAEVIAENFSIETLQQMTGLKYPTREEKNTLLRFMAMAQGNDGILMQAGIDPEEAEETLKKPTWEEIKAVLESDVLRTLSIDIETDSTLRAELVDDKRDINEVLSGVMDFIERAAPAVNAGVLPMDAAKALLMSGVRRLKLGTEVEDALSKIGEQKQEPQEQQPDPELLKMQAEMQKMQLQQQQNNEKQQFEIQKLQFELQKSRQEHAQKLQEIQAKSQAEVVKQQAQMQDKLMTGAN